MSKVAGIVFCLVAVLWLVMHGRNVVVSVEGSDVAVGPPESEVGERRVLGVPAEARPPTSVQHAAELPQQQSNAPAGGQVEITEEEEAVLALYDEMADAFANFDDCADMVEAADSAVAARESDIKHLLVLARQPRSIVPMERRQALSTEVLERMARFDVQLKRAMSLCSHELRPVLAQLSAIASDGMVP